MDKKEENQIFEEIKSLLLGEDKELLSALLNGKLEKPEHISKQQRMIDLMDYKKKPQ